MPAKIEGSCSAECQLSCQLFKGVARPPASYWRTKHKLLLTEPIWHQHGYAFSYLTWIWFYKHTLHMCFFQHLLEKDVFLEHNICRRIWVTHKIRKANRNICALLHIEMPKCEHMDFVFMVRWVPYHLSLCKAIADWIWTKKLEENSSKWSSASPLCRQCFIY